MKALELWGGPECTVNRVGDHFRDQLYETGHHDRPEDLHLFAKLGITALRYPLLWERIAPNAGKVPDWTWADARMATLRDIGIRPIVGLVHHGSGPRHINLLSKDFATGLAEHARAVVERYPWVLDWTPVNEPLTTARFAGLYGHWYPHHRDEHSFWLALLNETDGTRLAMREIRRVQPTARLVQTDDLGRTYATVAIRDQAAFDNARRWMGWDLLFGLVVPGHDLWSRLCGMGFEHRLRTLADDPCPPNVVGINHYLTSDRFLDHRVKRYPRCARGGNGRQTFVDTEAVRVLDPPPQGLAGAIQEAWERYRSPIALTEVHNGCTREEQMRWTLEAWKIAIALREKGVDVRAVASWALLGSTGWNTLLTTPGSYQPGTYDVGGGRPRPTAMVGLLSALANGEEPAHPVLSGQGWWTRDIRFHHPTVPRPAPISEHRPRWRGLEKATNAPILIIGATGTLGRELAAACVHRHIAFALTSREELDLNFPHSIANVLDRWKPWAAINAAGWVRVDDAEDAAEACMSANAAGAAALAETCASRGIPTVSFSSDLVFDGSSGRYYVESDVPAPLNIYGHSKAECERCITALPGDHLIVRTAAFFSPWDGYNFAAQTVRTLREGACFKAADDHVITPTYVPHLCSAVLDLIIDGATGIWHLSNGEALSWAGFARSIAERCGCDATLVQPVAGATLGWRAPRPAHVPLGSEKGRLLPPLGHAIERFAQDIRRNQPAEDCRRHSMQSGINTASA